MTSSHNYTAPANEQGPGARARYDRRPQAGYMYQYQQLDQGDHYGFDQQLQPPVQEHMNEPPTDGGWADSDDVDLFCNALRQRPLHRFHLMSMQSR